MYCIRKFVILHLCQFFPYISNSFFLCEHYLEQGKLVEKEKISVLMLIKKALFYEKKFLTQSNAEFLGTILFLQKITGLEKEKILLDGYKTRIDKNII